MQERDLESRTKRKFLKAVGASVSAPILAACHTIPQQRQRMIDQIVKEFDPPYLNKAYYDHDGSLVMQLPAKHAKRIVQEPRYQSLPESIKREREIEIAAANKSSLMETLQYSIAITDVHPHAFGQHEKSDFYIFEKAFQNFFLVNSRGKTVQLPVESQLRVLLRHQMFSAEYQSNGFSLADGQKIDSANYLKIAYGIFELLKEGREYISNYEFFKRRGSEKPEFIFAADNLYAYARDVERKLPRLTERASNDIEKIQLAGLAEKLNQLRSELTEFAREYPLGIRVAGLPERLNLRPKSLKFVSEYPGGSHAV